MRCLLSVVITLLCVGLVTSTSPPILPSPPIYEELPSVYLFTCDDRPDGTYPDPHDCTKFYECRNEKTSRRSCPDGLIFDIGNHPYGCEEPEYATCARCPESSHWTSCNGNCRPTCDDPNPPCPKVCRPGCKCNQGYVWYGEKCIAEHACRYKPSGGQRACPENSHWNTCGDLCVGTCDNPRPPCPRICAEPACACNDGYVSHNGKCIPESQCPGRKACPENSHWNTCGDLCVGTCDNPRPPCPRICAEPACACNDGYVSHNGKCIPESQCPKQLGRESVPECKYGAYYNSATGQCVCDQACDRKLHRVCGSDGQIYNNPCLLEVAACVNQQDIRIIGEPPCPSSGQEGKVTREDTDASSTPTERDSHQLGIIFISICMFLGFVIILINICMFIQLNRYRFL
ncbi:agrin-like isoform X3 [Branchiostoma floridae x Branchiostoma belcheri]